MSAFLHWLAGVVARWLNRKDKNVTASIALTPGEAKIAAAAGAVFGDLGALGSEAVTFWDALVAAAAAKFGDVRLDALAGGYGLIVLTQAVADVPSPIASAAAMALTVEKLAINAAPQIIAAGKIISVLAGLHPINIHGADPTLSAAEGGFPEGATGGKTGRR